MRTLAVITAILSVASFHFVLADEPTVAEKNRLKIREIVRKRNQDDGHLPTEITGTAILPDGSPAVGFKIDGWSRSLLHENYGDDFFEAVTDENGHFTLSLWRPYLYWIRITDPKGIYVAPDQHFELKESLKSDAVRFQLRQGIVVEGMITDQNTNRPIADLPVWLIHKPVFKTVREFGLEKYFESYEKEQQMPRQTRTAPDGRFRFVALPSEYLVSLCDCYGIFRPVPEEHLAIYARFIEVERESVDVKLSIPTPWRGRLLQKDGTPAAFYPVEVLASTFGSDYVTDREGRFTIFMSPEFHRILVDTPDQNQWFCMNFEGEKLPPDSVFQLYSPLTATGRLVRKSTAEPLRRFQFACRPRSYATNIFETDENGRFELNELFLNHQANLCFLNEPEGFNACAIFHTFKSFTPTEADKIVNLGVIELEESGWLAPDFQRNLPGQAITLEGMTADGRILDWTQYRGQVVLIEFWATWCGPCLREIPHLKEIYAKYRDRGFEIIGISVDEDLKALEDALAKHDFPWTNLADQKWKEAGKTKMSDRFAVHGVPHVILLDREGKVVAIGTHGEKLETELKRLLEM